MVFDRPRCQALIVALISCVGTAQATNIAWINTTGGDFSSGANWVGGSSPQSTDIALFATGLAQGYTASFSSDVTNSGLLVGNSNVTFDLEGHTYTLNGPSYLAGSYSAQIGAVGGGTLTVVNGQSGSTGTLSTVYAGIGVAPGETGTVSMSGKTHWTGTKSIYVGDAGAGTLNIQSGASVSDLIAAIGNASTGVGNVTVDGAGSTWTSDDYLYVGSYGTGNLTIEHGGRVVSGASYIGQYGDGTASVSGAGSSWSPNYLNIGYNGSASLEVTGGATLSDSDAYISASPDSAGVVTISGTGTRWTNSSTLYVGLASAATLNIRGGEVSVTKIFGISNQPGTQVNLSGGTLRVGLLNTSGNPSLFLGDGVSTGWTGGTLDITNSDLAVTANGTLGSSLTLGKGKTLRISGATHTLSVSEGSSLNLAGGSVYAETLNNAGTVSLPAGSTAEVVNPLVNTGLIDVSGGVLQLDAGIAGSSVREQILEACDGGKWDSTSGIGSSLAANDATGTTGLGYFTSGSVTTVKYTWYGDANGDGVVNGKDIAAVKTDGTTWQTGDFNYDGVVNADDWSLLQLGIQYGAMNIADRVPEPAEALMVFPAVALLGRRRRRA